MFIKPDQLILLVEDSPEDYHATLRSFRRAHLANSIYHCEDGESALDYLHQRGDFAEGAKAPRPGLILLDLNLPGTDGYAVLRDIKQDESLASIPVIVLTMSTDEHDIQACYRAGANGYVKKPVDLDGFIQALGRLADYWFQIVVLPQGDQIRAAD